MLVYLNNDNLTCHSKKLSRFPWEEQNVVSPGVKIKELISMVLSEC